MSAATAPNPTELKDLKRTSDVRDEAEELSSPAKKKSRGFPNFAGKVYRRPVGYVNNNGCQGLGKVSDYTARAYQYASTSNDDPKFALTPASIIYAANLDDVKLAIEYASACNIGLAVRSGGHAFGGASSTNGENLQLDMESFNNLSYDEETQLYTVQTATFLSKLSDMMHANGHFVPHGQCGSVRAGGHLQTGGYSPLCGRSFGFFCDYVTQFKIVTADLEERTVTKPIEGKPDQDNDDLWFSVIGGSPGNLGVVTEMVITPLKNEDYKESRCSMIIMPYSKKAQQACMDFIAIYNDNDDWPADYNLASYCYASNPLIANPNLDTKMSNTEPEIYGGKSPPHPTIICLTATFCGNEYTQEAKDFFQAMEDATKEYMSSALKTAVGNTLASILAKVYGTPAMPQASPDKHMTMSELTQTFDFPTRTRANPYDAIAWCGQSQQLSKNGFAEWGAEMTDQLEKFDGAQPFCEWIVNGGKYSRFRLGAYGATPNPVALPFRDLTMLAFLWVHYDNTNRVGKDWAKPREFSENWIKEMGSKAIGPDGIIATKDRRWMGFPAGKNLDELKDFYFSDEASYERVLATKKRLDPRNVFSANLFCVGASELARFK